MQRRGFTLVELLVVLAIITILAGIILPVISAARERARQTQCMSNLKNFGQAMAMYVGDFDGLIPLSDNSINPQTRIQVALNAAPEGLGILAPYVSCELTQTGLSDIYFCPSAEFLTKNGPAGVRNLLKEPDLSAPDASCSYIYRGLTAKAQKQLNRDVNMAIVVDCEVRAFSFGGEAVSSLNHRGKNVITLWGDGGVTNEPKSGDELIAANGGSIEMVRIFQNLDNRRRSK